MLQTWLAGIGAKLLAVVAVLAVIGGCFWYVKSLSDDVAKAKAEATQLKIEKAAVEAELVAVKKGVEDAKEFVKILNDELAAARGERQAMVSVFASHNFAELVEKKPGLVTLAMRRATERVWADFEAVSKPLQTNGVGKPVSKSSGNRRAEDAADTTNSYRAWYDRIFSERVREPGA